MKSDSRPSETELPSSVPTIRDVARMAGVSVSTVSHVMNNTRHVEADTRQRVMQAMQDLNYHPNRLARGLRNQQTHTLGVLLPNSANPFFAEVLRGVEDTSFSMGYSVIIGNANDDPERELTYLKTLVSKQIDGALLISTGAYDQALDLLARYDMPTVVVDRSPGERAIDTILVDNLGGGRIATEYLLSLGHRRIGCIAGPPILTPSAGRAEGYRQALQDAGLNADESLIVPGGFTYEGGYQACQTLLEQKTRPTAIFACNDLMAVGALSAIHQAGLRAPDDISLIGFDNVPLASYIVPGLTTIAQPAEALGRTGIQTLIQRIQDRAAPQTHTELGVYLVERESCRRIDPA